MKKTPLSWGALALIAASLGAAGAADSLSPSAQAQPSAVEAPLAPMPASATAVAGPLTPSAASPLAPVAPTALTPPTGLLDALTPTGAALAPPIGALTGTAGDPLPPEEVADPLAQSTQPLDLASLASPILLKLARALSKGSDKVWFDPELQQALSGYSPSAQSIGADPLFAELNRRAAQGDKGSKQALDLAVKLHGDLRALPVTMTPSAQALSPAAQTLSPSAQP